MRAATPYHSLYHTFLAFCLCITHVACPLHNLLCERACALVCLPAILSVLLFSMFIWPLVFCIIEIKNFGLYSFYHFPNAPPSSPYFRVIIFFFFHLKMYQKCKFAFGRDFVLRIINDQERIERNVSGSLFFFIWLVMWTCFGEGDWGRDSNSWVSNRHRINTIAYGLSILEKHENTNDTIYNGCYCTNRRERIFKCF